MNPKALELLLSRPAQVARWCGSTRLTDSLHDPWMREMLLSHDDMTLLAHRGSFKTTAVAMSIAIAMCAYPKRNILFLRKTDDDVIEVLRQVKMYLQSDALRYLTELVWGEPVSLLRSDQFSVTTNLYAAPRGASQLLGQGIRGSLTGKHADLIFTDDIVNLDDRLSATERAHTRGVYQELQNIRIPGGRIINAGTPWHPRDALSLMPSPRRFDCYHTGLLTPEQIGSLRRSMTPSLFAANYELRHLADEDALFSTAPRFTDDAELLRDGIAHLDAAYGGDDCTALTCGARHGDTVYLYGRLWTGHVDSAMEAIVKECERLMCAPIWCEVNGDRGYVARELRRRGALVRTYQERANKHMKIATHLYHWWPNVVFLSSTDPDYLDQILSYSAQAPHDDAPDSAASLLRLLKR